jgi:hypothetical protein
MSNSTDRKLAAAASLTPVSVDSVVFSEGRRV